MRYSMGLRAACLTVGLAVQLVAADVTAQSDPATIARVNQLFGEAKTLMAEGHYSEACPKLAEATGLAPAGVGGKITLAECYRGWGKLASAHQAFQAAGRAAEAAHRTEKKNQCDAAAAALVPRFSRLTILVPETLRSLSGLEVTRDGVVVPSSDWGVAIPLDPGVVRVRVAAAGKIGWDQTVELRREGVTESVKVPVLGDVPKEPALLPTGKAPTGQLPPVLDGGENGKGAVVTPPGSFWSVPRVIGALAGAVGAGLVIGGSYSGLQSKSRRDESHENGHCDHGNQCDAAGYALQKDALAAGNLATGLFVPGAILLVGGAVLVIAGPRGPATSSVHLAVNPRGFSVQGTW
jgi:hypothetical protein